jgi:hypothetical protein
MMVVTVMLEMVLVSHVMVVAVMVKVVILVYYNHGQQRRFMAEHGLNIMGA